MADNTASNVAVGAGTGAAVGSVVPGIGTAIGAGVGGGAALIGGLIQAKQVAEAQKASAEQIAKLQAMIDKVQSPTFDPTQFTPEEYKIVGQYNPEVAAYVAEKAPNVVTGQTADAQTGQQARLAALGNLRGIANGDNSVTQQAFSDAAATADRSAQGTQGAIADDMAKRGLGGSGAQLAQQLSAQQGSGQRGAALASAAANQAVQARLQAIRDSGTLGGQVNADANNLEATNTGIVNSFNQRMATDANKYNQYASGVRNGAQATNLAAAQANANSNVGLGNGASLTNIQRNDANKQQGFSNEMGKVAAQTGGTNAAVNNINTAAGQNTAVTKGLADSAGILANAGGSLYDKSQKKKPVDEEDE